MDRFLPESRLPEPKLSENPAEAREQLRHAVYSGEIYAGRVLRCDRNKNLLVDLGSLRGVIPYEEAASGAGEGKVRDIAIISLVGRKVCYKVSEVKEGSILLSRRAAQEEALDYLMETVMPGDVIDGRITHLEQFGAFVDIGCGIISFIGIENISVSRIQHPSDRFKIGQDIKAAVLLVEPEISRITLTHRELLGTWEENAAAFAEGETVAGIVRGIESYGSFIELAPNLSGLAERRDGLSEGDGVSVFIKAIIPERMKIKLLVINRLESPPDISGPGYFINKGRLARWQYSPESCKSRIIERVFE
jgi:small subunit ribosomal protein S1